MQGRSHYYRVRLVAYDALKRPFWHLPSRIPSPIPTPMIRFSSVRRRIPHKIHLVHVEIKKPYYRLLLEH